MISRTAISILLAGMILLACPAQATPLLEGSVYPRSPARVLAESHELDRVDVFLELPERFLRPREPRTSEASSFDAHWLEAFSLSALESHGARAPGIRGVMPWVIDPLRPDLGWLPLVELLPPVTPPAPRPSEALQGGPPVVRHGSSHVEMKGALSGRVVYVSAGHGWAWNTTLDRWAAQRGNTHELVEDFLTAEAVNHYLVSYLERAGATVFTVREHDLQDQSAVVDAEPGGNTGSEPPGVYLEEGSWQDSQSAGFAVGGAPYQGSENPMVLGGNRITPTVQGEATATATWVPTVPRDGMYTVYVSYSQHSSRAQDAHYVITHLGGETHLRVNQQRHGQTWVRLGAFNFAEGQDPKRGAVSLLNDTAGPEDTWVSADAVRLGGGTGDVSRGGGSGIANSPTSGRPRWEECSRYYAQFAGAPPDVWDYAGADSKDDVSARSRYAAWQNEQGEDAVYISWHTNAPNPGRGTSTYVYGPNPPNGSYQFSGTEGSDQLAEWVHDEIVADIREAFDPSWKDRGIRSAYFGEVNPSHNPEMPAILVEVAFHDTAADADFLREPRFRDVVSRAFTQGLIRYFAARDDLPVVLPPGTPRAVRAWSSGPDAVTVAWSLPNAAATDLGQDTPSGYQVHLSHDGVGFHEAATVEGALEAEISGVTPGVPVFFQVTAFNDGGVSPASPVIPVIPPCEGQQTSALVVQGFYRLDGASQPTEELSPWGLATVRRHRQREVNTYDYLVEHAKAFASARIAIDGAEATAIEEGLVSLDPYRLVDWALGEESTVDETLSKEEQLALRSWMISGESPSLLISGAELLWDLDHKGDNEDRAFATDWLGVAYGADDGESGGVTLELNTLGAAEPEPLNVDLDDGSHGTYHVDYPDVLIPQGAAVEWGTYAGTNSVAASRFISDGGHRAYVLGFPLESIVQPEARAELIRTVVEDVALPTIGPDCGATPDPGEPVAEPTEDTWSGETSSPQPDMERPNVIPSPTTVSSEVTRGTGCGSSGEPLGPWVISTLIALLVCHRQRRSGLNPSSGG